MQTVLKLDPRAASVTAVQKAIYRMSGRIPLTFLSRPDEICLLANRTLSSDEELELLRHINDYTLRETITRETEGFRDAVLGVALMRIIDQSEGQ